MRRNHYGTTIVSIFLFMSTISTDASKTLILYPLIIISAKPNSLVQTSMYRLLETNLVTCNIIY